MKKAILLLAFIATLASCSAPAPKEETPLVDSTCVAVDTTCVEACDTAAVAVATAVATATVK
jgi:hypothetical protein